MELRRGLIRDELQLKTFLLFLLKHFYEPVPFDVLNDLALDRVSNYFEFIAALDDLVKNEMVQEIESPRSYLITVRGRFTLQAVEASLPYSTRAHAVEDIEALKAKTKRDASIHTSVAQQENSFCVRMELDADHGPILKLELAASDQKNAERLAANFRANAERIYLTIIEELTRSGSTDS